MLVIFGTKVYTYIQGIDEKCNFHMKTKVVIFIQYEDIWRRKECVY